MKKSILTKTFAVLASVAVLGVSSVIGASAASNGELSISSATAKAGETVTIDVSVASNPGITSFGAVITFDSALTFVEGEATTLLTMVDIADLENNIAIGGAATSTVTKDGVIASLTFTIPEDAEVDTEYEINWSVGEDGNIRQFQDGSTVYAPALVGGVITVVGEEEVTTPAETEAETTVATTPAATTPAVTVPAAPKTGSSTKGIAATSAVLLAAACSAVVLKKKRD